MRTRVTLAIGVVALVLTGATILLQQNITANTVSGVQPTLLFTNPQAAAQPTTWGKAIRATTVFDGKVFTGYGDWTANTGPIHMLSYDLATHAINDEYTMQTQAVEKMNIFQGRLYVPTIDHYGNLESQYAWRNPGSPQWGDADPFAGRTQHNFDILTATGTDLWFVGGCYANACAFHSPDGGVTWQDADTLRVPPQAGLSYARFYFAGALNGKLYVQAVDDNGTRHPQSNVFDIATSTWSNGPDLGGSYGTKMSQFNGKLVYDANGAYLYSFDGVQRQNIGLALGSSTLFSNDVANPGDGYYYVLYQSGRSSYYIIRSADLTTWYQMTGNIGNYKPRSFDVSGGVAYFSTDDSTVYSIPLVQPATPIGSTSTGGKGHK